MKNLERLEDLVNMANQGLLRKSESGKQWFITEKGEEEFKQ